jgi:hypothetical protein
MKRRLLGVMAAALVFLASSNGLAGQGASKVDLTGKWTFQVETSAGPGTPTVTFKQDGDKVTGHYSSATLGEADFTGSVKGPDVTFAFAVDVQGMKLDVTYAGTIESKDAMKGKVNISLIGDGTFTARRQ